MHISQWYHLCFPDPSESPDPNLSAMPQPEARARTQKAFTFGATASPFSRMTPCGTEHILSSIGIHGAMDNPLGTQL